MPTGSLELEDAFAQVTRPALISRWSRVGDPAEEGEELSASCPVYHRDRIECLPTEQRQRASKAAAMIHVLLVMTARRMVPETQCEDVREIIVSPYRVMYRRRDDRVEIVAIRHEARAFDEREVSP
jgi:plasmid stabilization system protein ParE